MLIEFIDALEEKEIAVNKNRIITVRPREEVSLYNLKNVTEIEFDAIRVYVKETYDQVINKINQ